MPEPGPVALFGAVDKPLPDRPTDQLRRHIVQSAAVAIGQDFGVAGHPQHIAQLAQFIDDRGIVGQPEGIRIGL